jgi:hypothetical protein
MVLQTKAAPDFHISLDFYLDTTTMAKDSLLQHPYFQELTKQERTISF